MILHNVSNSTGLLIELRACANAKILSNHNLHMVNIILIPERLKDAVGEAESQNILHSLFAHVVIDTVDLVFMENARQISIKFLSRSKVMAKGFFNYDMGPGRV